ncbi:MaoC family dehydratase [Nocardia jinanensis]|uniref:Acyl dehydratase n=1 Tax=Nocardia jinanensis TaxID=382504 RepID=A0A917RLT4_9NOCA|nr:MaoC family dehydratase N-terminal domain-containing protein [Nocardia jinanensis]GGL12649.1 acyl dehydratase [Nocardia jinanensis]
MTAPTGLFWQDMEVGSSQITMSRTVTETDLVTFTNWFGFTERLFLEAGYAETEGYKARLVPGALTYCIAEGLTLQTRDLYGTGLAFMHADVSVKSPVYVGDTLRVRVTVEKTRAASKGARGVVETVNEVLNQHDEVVLVFRPTRLVRGRE